MAPRSPRASAERGLEVVGLELAFLTSSQVVLVLHVLRPPTACRTHSAAATQATAFSPLGLWLLWAASACLLFEARSPGAGATLSPLPGSLLPTPCYTDLGPTLCLVPSCGNQKHLLFGGGGGCTGPES